MFLRHRKLLLFGFTATSALLLVASAAFACTVFRGTMTATPQGAGSGSSTAVGDGGDMTYCSSSFGASIPLTGDEVLVEVGSPTCGDPVDLEDGIYTVNYAADGASDCMTVVLGGVGSPVGIGVPIGTLEVSGGSGSTTVTVPGLSKSALNTVSLCVTSTTASLPQGNQVTIHVI